MRKKILWSVLAVLMLAGGGYYYWRRGKNTEDKKDYVSVTQGELVVKYQEVGELEPKVKVDVKSNVTGRIAQLLVDEGQVVKKGQLLAVVQPGQTPAERYLPFEVRAPISGTVIKRNIEVGDTVVSGLAEFGAGTALMTLGDLSRMEVKLDVNEVDVPKLSVGQKAGVLLDAFPGESFEGTISFIAPQAELNDEKVKIFKTKVGIAKEDVRLRPGMTARVEVILAQKPRVLKAPLEGLFEEGNKTVAYVLTDDSKAPPVERAVKTGLKDEVDAEVLDGLKAGDRLSLTKPEDKKDAKSS